MRVYWARHVGGRTKQPRRQDQSGQRVAPSLPHRQCEVEVVTEQKPKLVALTREPGKAPMVISLVEGRNTATPFEVSEREWWRIAEGEDD